MYASKGVVIKTGRMLLCNRVSVAALLAFRSYLCLARQLLDKLKERHRVDGLGNMGVKSRLNRACAVVI